ncbi:MAG: hypothetical protein ACM3Q1_07165 [Bacteroidales bacterium]
MSVSAVAPTPFYQDPERLAIGLPQASNSASAAENGDQTGGKRLSMFAAGDDEPSFWDLLDVINPLQHIPVVSNIYREITGDQIGVGARLVGGALFGGVIGLAASAVDCVVEEATGQDTGSHVLALFRDEHQSSPGDTQLAKKAPAQPPAAATVPAIPADTAVSAADAAVSSSPAKAVADNPAAAGPVIALPEGKGTAGQPMVFSLDGGQEMVAPAAPVRTSPPAPAAVDSQPAVLAAASRPAGQPLPLRPTDGRVMPMPQRNGSEAKPMPQITVPVSSGLSRSNTPVTGRPPPAPAAFAAPRAQVGQEALANQPMVPPANADGQTAAAPDWFTSAWGQALDKYQRANQRNDKAAGTAAGTSTLQ